MIVQESLVNKNYNAIGMDEVARDIETIISNINASGSGLGTGDVIFVSSLSDFQTAVGGVITLASNVTYIVTTTVDLLGSRLTTSGVCNLFGTSSETSFLTSTGLGASTPLITSIYTIVLERISFKDVGTCFSIDGNTNLVSLDWKAVNFINIPNVGVINKCDNFIFDTSSFLGSEGLRFTGSIGTIGLNNSLFRGSGGAGNIIELDASCVITRRFRMIYSSVIASSSTVGINVNASVTITDERYILDTVNFSGGGTYLSGVGVTSNKALFINCVGITNSAVNGQIYMQGNATATTIGTQNTFVKVAGTTTASVDNSKYLMPQNNRLTNDATITRKYLIQCVLSFNGTSSDVYQFGFFDSKLGAIRTPSKTKATANAAGRAENVSFSCVVSHVAGDYLEIHVTNTTGGRNATIDAINFIVTEIK